VVNLFPIIKSNTNIVMNDFVSLVQSSRSFALLRLRVSIFKQAKRVPL